MLKIHAVCDVTRGNMCMTRSCWCHFSQVCSYFVASSPEMTVWNVSLPRNLRHEASVPHGHQTLSLGMFSFGISRNEWAQTTNDLCSNLTKLSSKHKKRQTRTLISHINFPTASTYSITLALLQTQRQQTETPVTIPMLQNFSLPKMIP